MKHTTNRMIPAVLAALLLVGGLAACGDDDAASPSPTTAAVATTATAPPGPSTSTARPTTRPAAVTTTMAPTVPAASSELQARLDAVVAAGVPGVTMLRRDGTNVELGVAGVADLATAAPVDTDTVFRTGSVAKSFVATVMLQLDAEGVLSLDDTVEQWLPGVVPDGASITIRQLLGNRSGLFDFAADPQALAPYLAGELDHVWTPEQLVAMATAHAPNFAPGTAALYSNTDYTVAGMIIERATGRPVAAEVTTRIIEPLGLTHTTMPSDGALTAPYAHGYAADAGLQDVTAVDPSLSSFGGNLVSTPRDLASFFDALFGGRLLPPEALAEMQTTSVAVQGEVLGLGLQSVELPCGRFIGHSGSTPGYKAAAFTDLAGDRQFVIVVNSLTQDDRVGDEHAAAAFDEAVRFAACG
jgi:D-alanyl-D-alanine carboxypeptidase